MHLYIFLSNMNYILNLSRVGESLQVSFFSMHEQKIKEKKKNVICTFQFT